MIETFFENGPCGYFAFDDNATTLLINNTLASALDKPKSEIIGKSVESIFTLPTRIFFQTHLFPMIKMHGYAEEIFLTLLNSKGNSFPVLLNAKKIEWKGNLITSCACIFVPNRKKFEDELVAARKTAEKAVAENTELIKAKTELQNQTERLDNQIQLVQIQNRELKQFSHVITHNLKEPLRKILMYTGKLSLETSAPSLSKLMKANEQMKAVVSGLQQYVWLNEKKTNYEKVNLNMIVKEINKEIIENFPAVQISLQSDELPHIEGDEDQFKMMIQHLISNAVKFRKGKVAEIIIAGTIIKQNRFKAIENKYKFQDYLRLEIIDKGIGFDPIYAEHIFELFKKVHYSEGQGLGLALCKKIVENHNGHIKAESELNKFTKLTVWLPTSHSASDH